MTNHNPDITSADATASFSENSNTTGSSALHALTATMNFTDSDHSDTHTTSATLKTAVLSSGSVIPASSLAHFNTAMTSVIQSDSNGSGKLRWTFSDPDSDFDFLSKNQTLVLTYEIRLNDNHGGTTTQKVIITVTGTDDKPVINMATAAMVTEQADHTLSFSPDTVHIALGFTDADLTNTGHTATVTGVTASGVTTGILPGSLGTAELMSFFKVDNVVKASGSGTGTINTTFSAFDLAFDYLADGEHLDITYTVRLDDHAGGISTQTVVVTVVGTNDAPIYLSGPESAHLIEGQNVSPSGNLTAHGDLFFTDIDLSDAHTVSTTVTATRSSGGSVPLSNAALLAAMSTPLEDSTGHLLGEVDWNFAIQNSDISFLSAGETLTLTYDIAVSDGHGGSATQTATITILGTNHPVAFTSGPESASLSEQADTTGSAALDTTSPVPTGTLTFTDQDLGDTHTVTVSVASDTWSGGSGVPAATEANLQPALLTTLNDSTGSGTGGVDWTFSIADKDLDFLAAGETLTVNYNVTVQDGSTSSTETVTVTATGANDAPAITSGPESASVAELPNTTGSSTLDTTSPVPTGTLSFTDVDLTDTHTVGVAVASIVWSFDPSFIFFGTLVDDLAAGLATTLQDSTGSGSGGVEWTFSIPDRDVDFLSAGETLTVTYNVAVNDAATSSTEAVTITITGAEDPLIVNPATGTAIDTVFPDTGSFVAFGNVISDAGDTAGDATTSLSISDVNGSAANVGTFVAGTYGSLLVFSDGFYLYQANSDLDPLQTGDNPTDQFDFTVTDSLGRSVSTTLTLNVVGGDDAPTITGGVVSGSLTEDAGPSLFINGGFETGDFTGWTVGGADIQVQFLGVGGEFGNYAAHLSATGSTETLSQSVETTPGQHYIVSFFVTGDSESSSNSFTATWDGMQILALTDQQSGGFTHYTFDLVATDSLTALQFAYSDDGTGLNLDQVSVNAATGPATESTDGSISFADIETADTHAASFVPQSGGYVGTFSLDPVTEASGTGSVDWHFTVDNSDIQFLSQNQSLTQTYTVSVTDNHGASTAQDVTITLNGTNDAPTAVSENVITDVGPNGTVDIPPWALAANDTDPDMLDTVSANSILSSSGGTAFPFGDAFFADDATLGGSFTYDVTDGMAVSSNAATATVINNATSVTTLTGTSGDDILIGNNGSEALSGGGGNDILIGNAGSHVLTGDSGNDIFAFVNTTDGPNTITDFNNTTEQDLIAVSAAGFGGGLTAGMDVTPVFETSADDQFSGFGAVFHFDSANQTLYFSADGTTSSAIALAQLQVGAVLHANDLLIV